MAEARRREPPYLLHSVDSALRLLSLVSERRSVRITEAAEFLGVVPSTAHRLLSTLRYNGFVVQEVSGGAYSPGPALAEVALGTLGGVDVRQAARPVLEEIKDKVQETVNLVVLERNRIRFIESLEGPQSLRVGSRLGFTLPAQCTSVGKALLALLSADELERRFPDHQLERLSPRSIRTWEGLLKELAEVRRRGYGINCEEGDVGIAGLGAAIRHVGGGPLAGVAIGIPVSRFTSRKTVSDLAAVLLEGVDTIEQRLRAGSGPGRPVVSPI